MFFGSSFDPSRDIPDLSGKVFLVTGGNTGLGKETVLQLAKHNAQNIYLAARTQSKAEAAIAEIQAVVPNAKVTFLPLDLASFASIQAAATQFKSESSRLDVLINNAGIMAVPNGKTKEGYEIQFGTNHLGHFLLTKLLLPILLKTTQEAGADVRIVSLSSEGHNLAPSGGINFDDLFLSTKGPWARYGQSKLANILFARALAKRHPTITSAAVHPGLIKTDLYLPNEESSALLRWGKALLGPLIMQDVMQGARNQLWAATAGKVESGAYYTPMGKKNSGGSYAHDDTLAQKLWEWSEEAVKSVGATES